MVVFSRVGVLLAVLMYAGSWPAEAADRTWTGTASPLWSDPANWETGVPGNGDNLLFPLNVTNQTTMNDLPVDPMRVFGAISVTGGNYFLAGNAIHLKSGINVSGGSAIVSLGVTLAGSQSFVGVTMSGPIDLAGNTLTIDGPSDSSISGVISGAGALVKNGSGVYQISGNNSYTGSTTINAGAFSLAHGSALGSPADGTTVANGATVNLLGGITVPEPLTLTGRGNVGGGALRSFSGGTNTSTGDITLTGTSVTIRAETGAPLVLSGVISGSTPTGLTFGGGDGTITVGGNSTFSGPILLLSGTALVTGTLLGSDWSLNSATLGGTGTVGRISPEGGAGTVSPGTSPGALTVSGNLTLDSTKTFGVELNGTTAGTGYDQLVVAGTVNLGSSTLNAALGFASKRGNAFRIIDNDGADAVVGTFNGLPEGASLTIGGVPFVISYAGGTGNDVILTDASPAAFTRYFAEGTTSAFFDTRFAILNPGTTADADVTLRFLKSDGTPIVHTLTVPALGRETVEAKLIPGLETAEFSTVIESDLTVVVDRHMTWDGSGYGSHAETSIAAPATTWYLVEGATHSGFSLFYLIQNPHSTTATATVTYLRPDGLPPLTKQYAMAANSRFNIWVNSEAVLDPALADLGSTDVSAIITSDLAIIVERAMYLNSGGLLFGAGHESAGVTATGTN
jgi:autotransporter-associated beta strand protein